MVRRTETKQAQLAKQQRAAQQQQEAENRQKAAVNLALKLILGDVVRNEKAIYNVLAKILVDIATDGRIDIGNKAIFTPTKEELETGYEVSAEAAEVGWYVLFLFLGELAYGPGQPPLGKSCFPAGTPVATSEGLRPIETIRRRDRVWAYDLVKSEWRLCRVARPYSLPYNGTSVFVTVAGETIESTYRHPYWVIRGEALESRPWLEHLALVPDHATTSGRWVDACDLRVGDQLLLRDGRVLPIERVLHGPLDGTVYNMEVEELHCYGVGLNSVLVHNNNGPQTGPGDGASLIVNNDAVRLTAENQRLMQQIEEQWKMLVEDVMNTNNPDQLEKLNKELHGLMNAYENLKRLWVN